jgi:hypothetical protein
MKIGRSSQPRPYADSRSVSSVSFSEPLSGSREEQEQYVRRLVRAAHRDLLAGSRNTTTIFLQTYIDRVLMVSPTEWRVEITHPLY